MLQKPLFKPNKKRIIEIHQLSFIILHHIFELENVDYHSISGYIQIRYQDCQLTVLYHSYHYQN